MTRGPVQVMGRIDDLAPAGEVAWVQRQACMSIRNIAARSPELRPVILAKVPPTLYPTPISPVTMFRRVVSLLLDVSLKEDDEAIGERSYFTAEVPPSREDIPPGSKGFVTQMWPGVLGLAYSVWKRLSRALSESVSPWGYQGD